MIELKNVQGSKEASKDLIVGFDTVYVHTNQKKIERESDNKNDNAEASETYEYDEIQYTKDEFIELLDKKLQEKEQAITDLQLALVEIYEGTES